MGEFTKIRKSEITGQPEHSIGYRVLYNNRQFTRQRADGIRVPFETQDANFNPDCFEVMNNDDLRQITRAKFLKYRGEYILDGEGNPYIVPYTFDFDAFVLKYQSFAEGVSILTKGDVDYKHAAYLIVATHFRPGAIDDLQRSYDGTNGYNQTFFMSFTASASFVYGVASSIMGLNLDTSLWGGGKLNEFQSNLPEAQHDTSGEYGNNKDNPPHIRHGYKFAESLRTQDRANAQGNTNIYQLNYRSNTTEQSGIGDKAFHTAYKNLEQQAQNYLGSPTPLSKQEVEFGVYWGKGPFDVDCKYKNGVMLPDYQEKLLVLQRQFEQIKPTIKDIIYVGNGEFMLPPMIVTAYNTTSSKSHTKAK